jgi:hypothetical protein
MGSAARSRRTDFLREDAMTRTSTTRASKTGRWIHRPRRHHWLADTRDTDYSTARLMTGGYGSRTS